MGDIRGIAFCQYADILRSVVAKKFVLKSICIQVVLSYAVEEKFDLRPDQAFCRVMRL